MITRRAYAEATGFSCRRRYAICPWPNQGAQVGKRSVANKTLAIHISSTRAKLMFTEATRVLVQRRWSERLEISGDCHLDGIHCQIWSCHSLHSSCEAIHFTGNTFCARSARDPRDPCPRVQPHGSFAISVGLFLFDLSTVRCPEFQNSHSTE